VSVDRELLGLAHKITRIIKGRAIPMKTIRLGTAVQSLKKQITRPIIPKAATIRVPCPTPSTKP
jgi:hypothetical protein